MCLFPDSAIRQQEGRPRVTNRIKALLILFGIVVISGIIFATRTDDPMIHAWHIFFRKLYFIPILAGAVWFGLRGSILTAVVVTGFYMLHLFFDWPRFQLERLEQIGEMASYLVFSGIAGLLVNFERRAEAKAQQIRRQAQRTKVATVVASLSETLGVRDRETRDHSRRVADLASGFARFLDLPQKEIQDLYLAAILHDIGKIGIRDDVLLKPEALTPEERKTIMEHPRIAERILAPVGFSEVIRYVAVHHENWDGSGYPEGLQKEQIPLPGRILTIGDTYDALQANRPYHQGLSNEDQIRKVMSDMAGVKLDETLLMKFWEYLDKSYGLRGQRQFTPPM